ncbi:GGDEF domain-containing protein [Desulfogranum japonicum]|uniref:GGDEF domain-containing protein n=1 Tax=Desulfogranum japonicum TaxID=231447 RepID=UPI000406EB73|nr:GGDEF domain-containing protein [Desulfogranum japonicum]
MSHFNAVAEHSRLAIASLRLKENLRRQALKDSLTGLYNRRFLMETIEHSVSRAKRHSSGLGVFMLDIDHFKVFNDQYGHGIGDFVLTEFSSLLQSVLRKEDIACRYGGEEFTVLLVDTKRELIAGIAHKLCEFVRNHSFHINRTEYGPVTVSIGVATFPENGSVFEQLLDSADKALYEAKNAGRDRVVLAAFEGEGIGPYVP